MSSIGCTWIKVRDVGEERVGIGCIMGSISRDGGFESSVALDAMTEATQRR